MVLDPEQLKTAAEIAEIGSGLIVGAEFLPTIVGCAKKWISAKFHGHPQKAIDAALSNFNDFSGQVNICLGGMQQIEGFEEKKEQALADPDYTSLFQEAAFGAARINSEQKHKLLARLVTDRLTAEPDSLRNLAAHMACNAVPQLSNMHLKLLGALYVIHHYPAPSYMMDLPYDERIDVGTKWFLNEIAPFIPIGELTDLDFAHLTAVSCITYVPQVTPSGIGGSSEPGSWKLPIVVRGKLCHLKELYRLPQPIREPQIDQNKIGKNLLAAWENSDMRKASLTPAGSLIGMYVRDTLTIA